MGTLKNLWVGSQKLTYDNAETYPDTGATLDGIRTEGQIYVEETPTEDYHVARLMDISALVVTTVSVSSISDPSTELASHAGSQDGDIAIAYQPLAGSDSYTIYCWDSANTDSASSPYICAGSSGKWIAVGGKYVYGAQTLSGNVGVGGTLAVTGAVTLTAGISVGGNLTLSGYVVGDILPSATGTYDLGSSTYKFQELHLAGAAALGSTLAVTGAATLASTLSVTGAATFAGNVTLGDTSADIISFTGVIGTALTPASTASYDLGTATYKWRDAYLSGDLSVGDALTVVGAVTMSGAVAISGATTFTGNVTIGSEAGVKELNTGNCTITGDLLPTTDDTYDLGSAQHQFQDMYLSGSATIGGTAIVGALSVIGAASFAGNVTLGNATSDDITITGSIAATILTKTTNSYDLGSSSYTFKSGYFGTSVVVAGNVTISTAAVTGSAALAVSAAAGHLTLNAGGPGSVVYLQCAGTSIMQVASTGLTPTDDATQVLGSASKSWASIYGEAIFAQTRLIMPSAAYGSPAVGDMYIDDATGTLYVYCTGAWKSVALS